MAKDRFDSRYSRFPISRLILETFASSGRRFASFVKGLGYKNVGRGAAEIDRWLIDGGGEPFVLRGLERGYHVERGRIERAVRETSEQIRAERGDSDGGEFYAYLIPETSGAEGARNVDQNIALFVLNGDHEKIKIEIPATNTDPASVARIVRDHFVRCEGRLPSRGSIVSYLWRCEHDRYVRLDIDGEVRDNPALEFMNGVAVLNFGSRTLTQLLA